MSHNYYDSFDDGLSDCCGANILLNGICHKCGEHCEPANLEDSPTGERSEPRVVNLTPVNLTPTDRGFSPAQQEIIKAIVAQATEPD